MLCLLLLPRLVCRSRPLWCQSIKRGIKDRRHRLIRITSSGHQKIGQHSALQRRQPARVDHSDGPPHPRLISSPGHDGALSEVSRAARKLSARTATFRTEQGACIER